MSTKKDISSSLDEYVELFLSSCPPDPLAPNYHNARKLKAAQCLAASRDAEAAFHLSEATAASLRTMAVYRQEQLSTGAGDKMMKISNYLKPIENIMKTDDGSVDGHPYEFLHDGIKSMEHVLDDYEELKEEPLHRRYLRFTEENNVDNFLNILRELPEEWTVVQLTASYNPNESIKPLSAYRAEIDSIYVTLLRNEYTDAVGCGPLTVQLPANVTKEGERPLWAELYSLLDANLQTIENASHTQKTIHKYWEKRQETDLRMLSVIKTMDKCWLGGWRCLLRGRLQERGAAGRVRALLERTCEDWGFIRLTATQKALLCNLLESSAHIPSDEIRSTLQKILTQHASADEARAVVRGAEFAGCRECRGDFASLSELCLKCLAAIFEATHYFSLADGIKAFMGAVRRVKDDAEWEALKSAKRHPVILIVDEMLDTFPWESSSMLAGQPVSRMESLHFLYNLYKTHESDVVDGHFLVRRRPVLGRYVINPDNNLDRMEKRMSSFVSYWCPEWGGERGRPPAPNTFLEYLRTCDLFLYCGHGDGLQYACGGGGDGAGVETAAAGGGAGGGAVRAAAMLSGCGSTRLQRAGGRVPPLASHYHYHIAGSPMVVGMLWEVTDMEVDKVVTSLLAALVPSRAPVAWDAVGKAQWSRGELELNVTSEGTPATEHDLLSAVARARRSTSYLMISSSVVARGLPVRVQPIDA